MFAFLLLVGRSCSEAIWGTESTNLSQKLVVQQVGRGGQARVGSWVERRQNCLFCLKNYRKYFFSPMLIFVSMLLSSYVRRSTKCTQVFNDIIWSSGTSYFWFWVGCFFPIVVKENLFPYPNNGFALVYYICICHSGA